MESAAWSATSHECLLSRVILPSAIHFSALSSLCCLKLLNVLDDTEFLEKLNFRPSGAGYLTVFAFDRLMLFDEEHSDPVALTEILLETCSSITHSLGKWTSPGL